MFSCRAHHGDAEYWQVRARLDDLEAQVAALAINSQVHAKVLKATLAHVETVAQADKDASFFRRHARASRSPRRSMTTGTEEQD